MSNHIENYPLIRHLEKDAEFFTTGVFVCIVNLDLLPQYLIEYLESPDSPNIDADSLDYYLDQVRVWVVKEKKKNQMSLVLFHWVWKLLHKKRGN